MDLVVAAKNARDITWNPRTKQFMLRTRRGTKGRVILRGVHPVIDKFKPYHIKQHIAMNTTPTYAKNIIEKGVSSPCVGVVTGDETDSRGCKGGKADDHGTIVDDEMTRYANTPVAERGDYLQTHKNLDRCTKTLIKEMNKRGIVPVAAQVIVGDINIGCATRIDMVCRDSQGQTIVVELKATMHTNPAWYTTSTGKLLWPFDNLDYSCQNVDMLQLLTTCLLVERGNTQYKKAKPLLIRVSGNVAIAYEPESWFHDTVLRDTYYNHLKACAREEYGKKKARADSAQKLKKFRLAKQEAIGIRKKRQMKGAPLKYVRCDDV